MIYFFYHTYSPGWTRNCRQLYINQLKSCLLRQLINFFFTCKFEVGGRESHSGNSVGGGIVCYQRNQSSCLLQIQKTKNWQLVRDNKTFAANWTQQHYYWHFHFDTVLLYCSLDNAHDIKPLPTNPGSNAVRQRSDIWYTRTIFLINNKITNTVYYTSSLYFVRCSHMICTLKAALAIVYSMSFKNYKRTILYCIPDPSHSQSITVLQKLVMMIY